MIRDVVLHMPNEQPLIVDLPAMPGTTDTLLVCSNLRLMNGQTPVFVDRSDSVFIFPLHQIRFIEILRVSLGEGTYDQVEVPQLHEAEPDLELDEEFLRRIREA
jgi:hypothetical protein